MAGKPWGNPPEPVTVLINNGTIGAGNAAVTEPLDVMTYSKKTIYVKSTCNIDVYIKGGPDENNMCFLTTGTNVQDEDGARSWNVDNTLKCWEIAEHLAYLQVVINNIDSTEATVSVWLSGE